MIKIFFYWLFQKSKTLQQIQQNQEVIFLNNIYRAFDLNQHRSFRRKFKRITENKNSPFYIYK